MKKLMILGLSVFSVLTAVEPIWAQDDSGSIRASQDDVAPARLSDLGMRVNPQLGLSSFEYSENGGDSKPRLSGGATFEFGAGQRILETGLLVMQTGSTVGLPGGDAEINSTYLTIPMMAKLRVLSMKAQSWYGKFGFMPAFELSSNRGSETNNIDVLGTIGAGGRLYFNSKSEFIVEATYNRGLMDAVRANGENYNQGFLILAGMSFRL